jgi:hypothetical protein
MKDNTWVHLSTLGFIGILNEPQLNQLSILQLKAWPKKHYMLGNTLSIHMNLIQMQHVTQLPSINNQLNF